MFRNASEQYENYEFEIGLKRDVQKIGAVIFYCVTMQ